MKRKKIYDYSKRLGGKLRHFKREDKYVDLDCSKDNLLVSGDVKLVFSNKAQQAGRSDRKMFTVWFNTAFVENDFLCFEKIVLDKACKDKQHKKFDKSFQMEVFLEKANDEIEHSDLKADAVEIEEEEEEEEFDDASALDIETHLHRSSNDAVDMEEDDDED